MKSYIYGMRIRGFSIGCQPKDGLIQRLDDETGTYWDLIEYDRPLDAEEVEHYSLDLVREDNQEARS